MRLLADFHTHSKNSRFHHGKDKIEEMVIRANEIGLVEIGITDHGYKHFFRTSKEKLKTARKIVNDVNTWSKTKVLLGVEADIISEDGTIDIDIETLSMLDILIVGYHRMISTNFAGFFGNVPKTKSAKEKCTRAFINAINNYPVTIVSHLDSVFETDLYEIGKACRERGTMVEINNRHTNWTEQQVEDLIASGCMFVVSSDAHSSDKIGEVDNAIDIIKKYNIPSERIANIEFTEEEKSDDDREYTAYKSVYEKLAKDKQAREDKISETKNNEIGHSLSNEMEQALRNIASEKGYNYSGSNNLENYDGFMRDMSDENAKLIAQAEEYIKKQSLQEFESENDSIENVDGETNLQEYKFSDDHPLLKNVDDFEERFQPLERLSQKEENNFEDSVKNEIVQQPVEQPTKPNIVEIPEPVEELVEEPVVATIPEPVLEPAKTEVKQQDKTEFTKTNIEPENFMASITQTNLINSVVSQQKEETKPEPEPKPVVKEVPQTQKRPRGGFIAVDNLFDDKK